MFFHLNILSSLLIALFILIAYIFSKFIVTPYLKCFYYKKQGAAVEFNLFSSLFIKMIEDVSSNNDFLYKEKKLIKQYPNVRMLVFNAGDSIFLNLIDPALIKEFYSKQDMFIKSTFSPIFRNLMKKGLIFTEGNEWKKQRKAISSMFHYEIIKSNISTMVETTREFFDAMETISLKNVKILDEYQKITGEVVGRIFFGKMLNKYSFEDKPLTLALAGLTVDISTQSRANLKFILGDSIFNHFPIIVKLQDKVNRFREVCSEIINDRKREIKNKEGKISNSITKKKDLLDILLETQETGNESAFSDEEIIDQFITFFMAGTDTTGHLAAIVTYNLYEHPQYLAKTEQEVNEFYKIQPIVTMENLNKMNFLDLVLKETLRFNGPVNNIGFRESSKDILIQDVKILKGTKINVNMSMNNHNPKYYNNPENFDPYRWAIKSNNDPYVYIPFSAGPRNCIGQHLSQVEAKIILSEFLSRYVYKISENYEHKMTARFLYEPHNELKLNLVKKT